MKKILTIIGARPQFIKASVVSKSISATEGLQEIIVHTGQHFDANMSDIFFKQLDIPLPNYSLNINGGNHGDMTGRMLLEIEKILIKEKPDCVLIYGDTNSTLAGALAASKLHIPIAHVEAGLRSFNMKMPEEINRILADRVSNILFCPTDASYDNLKKEGYPYISSNGKEQKIFQVGDVMQDSAQWFSESAKPPENFHMLNGFVLATIHRAENTDDFDRLKNIVMALDEIAKEFPVVLPIHPRTNNIIKQKNIKTSNILLIEPAGYLEMLWLLKHCDLVVTDSGGVQKEAFFMGKACVTLRDQTEWIELLKTGANELVGADYEKIIISAKKNFGRLVKDDEMLYGGGQASEKISACLKEYLMQ